MNLHRFIENDIMHVQFNCADRPVNTISPKVLDELDDIVSKLERGEEKPRSVIFESGKAGTFITGADLFAMREMDDAEVASFIERGQQLFHRISLLPMARVAAINGQCLGGGLELALACTHRVAADDGSITIGLPEVKLGILPGWGGSTRLPRLIGLTRSLPLLLTGKTLAPRKAQSLGVIDEVVPPEALGHAAERLALQKRRDGSKISQTDRAIARFNPLRNAAMKRARAQTLATTHGNYPAPEAVLDVVEIGMRDGVEAGLRAEREALQRLVKTDACRNLMRLFFLRQESKRAVREKLKAEPRDVKRVAVVGGGVMGSGIVHALVSADVDVRLIEIEAKQMSAALTRVKKQLDADLKSKRISPVQAKRAMHRVSPSLTFTGLGRVDFVIEAVLERPAVKRDVFDLLDGIVRPDAVLASNTSSLNLTELAEATAHPGRVMGMHFFNPVPKMPLLEVVRTPLSDDAALATGVALGQRIGKTPILVDDGPGFLVNRVLIPYLAEAIVLASEGAPINEVDRVMKRWGMPMGPFELLDQVGLDVSVDIFRSLGSRLGDHLPQVPNFEQVVDQGWRGRKSGEGFYRYGSRWWGGKAEPRVNTKMLALLGAKGKQATVDERTPARLVLPMVNEAARVLEEGVTDSTDTIDLATVLGLGWAPFRGGLARWAEAEGLSKIVKQMDDLTSRHGERFRATRLLRQVAEAGEPLQAIVEHRPAPVRTHQTRTDRLSHPVRHD